MAWAWQCPLSILLARCLGGVLRDPPTRNPQVYLVLLDTSLTLTLGLWALQPTVSWAFCSSRSLIGKVPSKITPRQLPCWGAASHTLFCPQRKSCPVPSLPPTPNSPILAGTWASCLLGFSGKGLTPASSAPTDPGDTSSPRVTRGHLPGLRIAPPWGRGHPSHPAALPKPSVLSQSFT